MYSTSHKNKPFFFLSKPILSILKKNNNNKERKEKDIYSTETLSGNEAYTKTQMK
jgi:hypothetical protein